MYKAYKTSNLAINNTSDDDKIYRHHARTIKNILIEASKNGRIDGTKVRNLWFPQVNAQVFLSHSHKDLTTAIKLSNWLESKLGITAFIDSAVWLYADDLLMEIDKEVCYQEDTKTYSYEKRNGTTSHVHMMLASALSLMLDSCECALFLDTPNSVSREEAVEKTGSPWIMYELNLMSLIRSIPPVRPICFSGKQLTESEKTANASLEIDYEVDLSKLTYLSPDDFNEWYAICDGRKGDDALDVLYENHQ